MPESNHSLNRRAWLRNTGLGTASLMIGARLAPTSSAAVGAGEKIDVARISGNENPYGPSKMAMAALKETEASACRYPGAKTAELAELIAEQNGVAADNVVLGNGSSEFLADYAEWLSRSGPGEVVTALPGYTKFTRQIHAMGSPLVIVPTTPDLVHDLDAMAAKVGPHTKCVYICNPNNPTSTIVPADELRAFAIKVSKTCPVFVDEAYLEFSDDFEKNTMAPLVAEGHNVIVARTFSKIYGMAGMRLGYGLAPADVAAEVRQITQNFLGVLTVSMGIASLQDAGYVPRIRAQVKAERDRLCRLFDELGLTYAKPQGNFVFVKTGMPVKVFQDLMLGQKVQVGRAFPPALDWCRISIGLPEEMDLCHAALKKVFAKA